MRRFQLERDTDLSGVSGTGVVAEGVEFTDGTCAMRWRTGTASTAVYASAEDVVVIHGHQGATRLVWLDDPGPEPIHVEFRPGADTGRHSLSRREEIIERLRRRQP